MSDLEELAARVEALEGPDREVDARIWCSVSPPVESYTVDNWMRNDPRPANQDVVGLTLSDWLDRWPDDAAKMADSYGVPKFTSSVDAAMSLVPEGHVWDAGTWRFTNSPAFANVGQRDRDSDYDSEAFAATPALALTAASLRARVVQS